MKAQFKYAFLSGLHIRGPVFAVIFTTNIILILFYMFGNPPIEIYVTAFALSGMATTAMLAANIIGDITIGKRMFTAPHAYLEALTPSPRWKTMLASLTAMTLMDFFSMAFVLASQAVVFSSLADELVWGIMAELAEYPQTRLYIVCYLLLIAAGYLLIVSIIFFSLAVKKSFFFKLPASGLLTFLLALGCVYVTSLLQIVLAPLNSTVNYGMVTVINLSTSTAVFLHILLTLSEAAVLFLLTSILLEKKVNL